MNRRWNSKDFKIGVLGGGQLGRMLIQEAIDLDVHLHMIDPDPNAPCALIAHSFTCGSITDYDTVIEFGKDKDLITVEIENVNIEALEALEQNGVKIFPQPRVLRIIKDKGIQKQFYVDHNIPTAPFTLYDNANALEEANISYPIIQKMRTGGYDGKGVQLLQQSSHSYDAPNLCESLIDFDKELSVIVARNENGDVQCFPSVECEFNSEANLVEYLFSPANISKEITQKANSIAMDLIQKLDMIGLLAVEFFLGKNGELLVNEIAPRPHNSGHHTIECCNTSQYAQHLRSVLNLPLGDTTLITPGAMINILGEKGFTGPAIYEGLEKILGISGVHPHIYGKSDTKPFRKMGHVTITGETLIQVKRIADEVKETIKVKA
ncbi:MAG: 5-(carboxyamino)imidazole ribonucleotide synthase [Crocinitomicaceae bacterium]|nr:5-(carboxyamino)imidazole ribonucleotide synthase [Crocinitomicaceae bacterium]OUT70354.1 MAG: 5-(carboxyamino)imidazole ribonucleotide synthase [Crocinitomicaceae bacterium TMED16]